MRFQEQNCTAGKPGIYSLGLCLQAENVEAYSQAVFLYIFNTCISSLKITGGKDVRRQQKTSMKQAWFCERKTPVLQIRGQSRSRRQITCNWRPLFGKSSSFVLSIILPLYHSKMELILSGWKGSSLDAAGLRNKTIWRHYQRTNFTVDMPVMVYRLEEKSELNSYIHLKHLRSFWFKAKADGCVLQITMQCSLLSMKGIRLDAFVKQRFSQEYGPPRKKEVFVKQREKMTQKQVKGMKVEYVMPAVGQPCTTKDTVSTGSNISFIPYRYIEMLFVV